MSTWDTDVRDVRASTVFLKSEINTDFTDDEIGSFVTKGGGVIQKDLWVIGDLQIDGTVNIPSNSNATQLQGVDISPTSPGAGALLQYFSGTGEWTPVSTSMTFPGDMTVAGDLTVQGTVTNVDSTDLQIEDNIILLNKGELGSGVSAATSGLEIDRGLATNYQIVFNEVSDTLEIGLVGSLEPVAIRETSPVNTGVAFWNNTNKRFETDADFTYDTGTDTLSIANLSLVSDITVPGTANLCDINCSTGNFKVTSGGAVENIIMGASSNTATIGATQATVSGGTTNSAFIGASVGGGSTNAATGNYAVVPGGLSNTASGMYSYAVGRSNTANMNYAYASGYNASAGHVGAYVWSDGTGTATSSSAANEFTVRASGGFRFVADTNVVPVNGVQVISGQNTVRTLAGAYIDANAVQIQGINVDSVGSPTDGQVLVYRSGTSQYEFEDQTGSGGGGGSFTAWTPVADTNVTSVDTIRYAKYISPSLDLIMLTGDVRITPTGTVSFIELSGLPSSVASVVGSSFGNSILIFRVSDGVASLANITALHGTSKVRVTSVFNAGQQYDIAFQLYYSAGASWTTFTPTAGTNVSSLTIRDARYIEVGDAVLITFDVRVLPTSAGSTIELNAMPFAAVGAVGSKFSNGCIIERVSDGVLSSAQVSIDHTATTAVITAPFLATNYDITTQIYYQKA